MRGRARRDPVQFPLRAADKRVLARGVRHDPCGTGSMWWVPRDAEPTTPCSTCPAWEPTPRGGGGVHRPVAGRHRAESLVSHCWRQDDAVQGCRLASLFVFSRVPRVSFRLVLFSCCCLCCVFSLCFLSSIKYQQDCLFFCVMHTFNYSSEFPASLLSCADYGILH